MKKLTIGLAVLLSGYAANSSAAYTTGGSKYGVCVPSFCGGFTFGIYGLYWRPSAPQLDYALTYPQLPAAQVGTTSTTLRPNTDLRGGHYHSVDPNYNWGFKVDVGYVFPCTGNDVILTYTNFNHSDDDRVRGEGRLILPSLGSIFNLGFQPVPFVALPALTVSGGTPTAVTGTIPVGALTIPAGFTVPVAEGLLRVQDVHFARANASFENHTWDLDFGQHVNIGCNLRLRWFGGLRYSNLENRLDARYEAASAAVPFTATLNGTTVTLTLGTTATAFTTGTIPFNVTATLRDIVNQKSKFNGIGPRFGVDANYCVGGGFGVVGSLSTSLLIGEIDTHLNERQILDTTATALAASLTSTGGVTVTGITVTPAVSTSEVVTDIHFRHPDETRVVPNIDAKLGLDYTYTFCNCNHTKLTIEAGWMVSHYFDAIDRVSSVEAQTPEVRSRHTTDVSFDGPYIGAQINL